MSLGRPKAPLPLDRELRQQLEAMVRSRSLPHGLVTRVRIVLLSAHGLSNKAVAAHKHPRVRGWLAVHPRYHPHFTPTYASWLNQVEIWFNIVTQKAIRRGTFRSIKELVAKIERFVHHYNAQAQPFSWTATADSIFEKIQRLCERISGTRH